MVPAKDACRKGQGVDGCTLVAVTAMDGHDTQDVGRSPPHNYEEEGRTDAPFFSGDAPNNEAQRLMACLLSGRHSENGAYLQRVQTSSWPPGNPGQRNNTGHTSEDGCNFVIGRTSIPLIPLYPTSSTF